MRTKKMLYWLLLIPVLVILLIIVIVNLDTSDNYVSRAMASKAMALALTDKEGSQAVSNEQGSHFAAADRDQWYTAYIDYLITEGYYEEGVKADREFAADALTYGEAAYAADKVSPGLSQSLNISRKKYDQPIPKEEWWLFYTSFLKAADPEGEVQEQNLFLYGTPDNVKEAAPWTAYTSLGILGFEGLSLDSFIDHEVKVLVRGDEIIHLSQDVSDRVVYRNVWLVPAESGRMNLYIGTVTREFPMEEGVEAETSGVLADITLDNGKIKKLSLKKDTIEGKVLAVREDSIEIEGYGTLKLDSDFKVYKTYGVIREQRKRDILVGYDLGKFVVADKKVSAALLVKSFSAKNIRVLLRTDNFSSLFHDTITLESDSALRVEYGGEEDILEPGTELTLREDDERLQSGRITIEPADPQKQITITSMKRGQGIPSYFGSLEVSREEEGLLLLNEIDVEDYLTRVVPSEMPGSYELEALKVQAVCARTYAYRQIQANAYSSYGAHVDDSTSYQVYNNQLSNEKTDRAVKETEGQMVFYGDTPAETYYFSTSSGHTTDGTIWGANLEDIPYLKGIFLSEGRELDLTTNDAFVPFIQGSGERNYDSDSSLYRWKTQITNTMLEETMTGIGKVQGIFVTHRGTGGIARTVKVVGSEGEEVIRGEGLIRRTLGRRDLEFVRGDGGTFTDWESLPSAFIAVDETARNEETGVRTFTIWGGGYGHGVGMSQNGAQAMAKQGKTYQEILTFFYTGVEVREME